MASDGKFLGAVMFICWLSSPLLMVTAAGVHLTTCPSENSVCNIGVGNDSGVTFLRQCECSDGRHCPSDIHKKDGTVFFEGKWLFTCSPRDTLPVCRPGQPSLRALSSGERDGGNIQVLCICSTPYTSSGATREILGAVAVVSFYCTGDQNRTENSQDEEDQISKEVLPFSDETNLYLSSKDKKQSRGNSAFYKRGGSDSNLNAFYKRGSSDSSAFYKRDRNHLSSFYKRGRFLKRAPFYKRKQVIAKRSVDDSFDDDTPVKGSSLSNIADLDVHLLSNFDKKGYGLNSFYKRGLIKGDSSFYKRGDYGTSSFYKRTPADGSHHSSLDADESDNFLTPEEESAEATSVENGAADNNPNYKRSLSNLYKRDPWSSEEGTSSTEEKRALGERNSAFNKRDDSSEENDTDKRARGRNLSSFYKRSRSQPSLSRFYKRYLSNTGDTYGTSSFYKRGLGDVSNFYKRGYGDISNFYKRGFGSVSNFYKRGVNDDSRFYKRSLNDDSSFYKRGFNDDSRFYKRGFNDDSKFYKRGLGDAFSFYKRSRGHSRFYKRDVGGVSSFYKRDPSNRFAFYKRGINGVSRFYKRGLDDKSSFYKRGLSDLSSFYKRGDKQYSFNKRNAQASPSLFTGGKVGSGQFQRLQKRSVFPNENKRQTDGRNDRFYKRSFNDLTAFYKRSPSDNSMYSFYKRSPSDNSVYSFYKRGPSDDSLYSFYKRDPSDKSVYSFYKRGSYDSSVSNFYKRIPYDHSSNSFYKRTNDINAFYKRAPGSNTKSSFYKRFSPDTNAFYKRFSPDLSSFYKRSPFDLQAFYKRALEDGVSRGDLENFMEQRQENYKQNGTSDHTDIGSIDLSSPSHLGDSTQQNTKQNLP